MRCSIMSCGAHGTIGKHDRVWRDASQNQFVALQICTACVEDDQRRHNFRFGLADCFLQWDVRGHARGRLCKPELCAPEQTHNSDNRCGHSKVQHSELSHLRASKWPFLWAQERANLDMSQRN